MLGGIVIIITGYFGNINDYFLNKIKRHSQDNMGVYHFVSRTKTRDKIATMYNILIIYSSKKRHSGKRRNKKYIQVHNYATVTGVWNKTMVKITWSLKKKKYIYII